MAPFVTPQANSYRYSKLLSELEMPDSLPIHNNSYTVTAPYVRNSHSNRTDVGLRFGSIDITLLQICQTTLSLFKALHTQMSREEILRLSTKLSIVQRRLDEWHRSLPSDLKFPVTNDPDIDMITRDSYYTTVLQYRYFEVKELMLRPWLYIALHVNETEQTRDPPDSSPTGHTRRVQLISEYHEKATHHQKLVLLRLHFELTVCKRQPFALVDGPWFKANKCVVLALLLLASRRWSNGISADGERMNDSYSSTILEVVASFTASNASDYERQYAKLLQSLYDE